MKSFATTRTDAVWTVVPTALAVVVQCRKRCRLDAMRPMDRHMMAIRNLFATRVLALLMLLWGGVPIISAVGHAQLDESEPLFFEQHVRPILKAHCFHCHGEDHELRGELDVRLVRLMVQGGASGQAIAPGNAAESLLWQRIEADEMPEGTKKLTVDQKRTIREWIDRGAGTLRPEPEDVEQARFTPEELSHWSFQPVTRPAIPVSSYHEHDTPIDHFIRARLGEESLDLSPAADRRTLIRRLMFDLHGLPPTRGEVERFVHDHAPNAYARLVDRLLASPQYGVRWGRHWLDVAGYAETNGDQATDGERPHIWRYRDYVVDAFNDNKPIDQFLIEQLAGDELIEVPVDIHNSLHDQYLTATGFLRLAPDVTRTSNTLVNRNMAVADAIQVISSSLLGLTVGCAQCHDHKYDPVGIDDYYAFRSVFDPVFPLDQWRLPGAQEVDFTMPHVVAAEAEIEERAKALEDDIRRRREAHGQKIQDLKLADVPEADREATREAVLTSPSDRTDEQTRLLKTYPMVKPVSTIAGGLLVEYDSDAYRRFEKENEQVAAIRSTKPSRHIVRVNREDPGVVPTSHLFFRGNPESPGDEVEPSEIMVLRQHRTVEISDNDERLGTTGRRLAYARQLTDGRHPLVARVFVNRVWLHHFGRGIVATPGDFGIAGAPPSHPELLDWLAVDFVEHGWDLKRLHRMIVMSRTYRQSSRRRAEHDQIDPDNELFARANVRRLSSEAIRDAILHVSSQLSLELGGPSLPVVEAPDGKIVIGRAQIRDGLKTGVQDAGRSAPRRSLYVQVRRGQPLNMLATFDQPEMTPNCEERRMSTVATQALWFLNDDEIVRQADELARLLQRSSRSVDVQLHELFLRLFAADPTEAEVSQCRDYLARQVENFDTGDGRRPEIDSSHAALASLCQVLLGSNRFLYVE